MKRQTDSGGIRDNRKALSSFILLCMAASAGVITPLLRAFSYLVLQITGYRYLTAENIWQLLRNPLIYLALLAAGLLYAVFELFQIGGLLYIYDRSQMGKHITFTDTVLFAAENVRGIFRRHYIQTLLAVLVITPVFRLGSAVNLLNSYSNFALFMKTLRRRSDLRIGFAAASLIILFLFLRWFYVCHYYTLEDYNFLQSARKSRRLMKRQSVMRTAGIFGVQLLAVLAFMIFSLGMTAAIGFGKNLGFSGTLVSTVQVTALNISTRVFDALTVPLLLYTMHISFMHGKSLVGEKLVHAGKIDQSTGKWSPQRLAPGIPRSRGVELTAFFVILLLFMHYMQSTARKQFQLRIEHLRTVEVSAHRGASMHYPENTMAAFVGAVEQGADWIELDVQESKDGQIFIMHDESLKRTTGVDQKSWELTYDEIREIDAGSFFNPSFSDERMPLLADVISYAKETGIRLNIELKPNDHQQNLVDNVLDIVEDMEFADQCVITSQKYEVLRQVKKRNEDIYTVYVMGLAYGAINRLKAADAFSIRSTSITQSLVTDLHNRGLEVYAWTVDSRANLNRMINLGVDNIITNNVPLAIECINDSRTDSILGELLKMLSDRFR